jgi:hypothetical protein
VRILGNEINYLDDDIFFFIFREARYKIHVNVILDSGGDQ